MLLISNSEVTRGDKTQPLSKNNGERMLKEVANRA
jgi:hypothetical protein